MGYLHALGIPVLLCTPFLREPRCNQQGDVSYDPRTRLRALRNLGFLAGLTSKPVYSLDPRLGHALTTTGNHNVPP